MAKFYWDVEQDTALWHSLRLGIPTASDFHLVCTPTTGQFSKSATKYAYYKIAEKLLGQPLNSIEHLEHVQRGKNQESDAIRQYEFVQEVKTSKVGFVTTDDGLIGASPDRLIMGRKVTPHGMANVPIGCLECKCPAPQTQIAYIIEGPGDNYRPQVQGQLLVAEVEWGDFYSYYKGWPAYAIRTHRDEPYIAKLKAALTRFNEMLQTFTEKVRAEGFFDMPAPNPTTPVDQLVEDMSYATGIPVEDPD